MHFSVFQINKLAAAMGSCGSIARCAYPNGQHLTGKRKIVEYVPAYWKNAETYFCTGDFYAVSNHT